MLSLQGVWVQSLARELRSWVLHNMAEKKRGGGEGWKNSLSTKGECSLPFIPQWAWGSILMWLKLRGWWSSPFSQWAAEAQGHSIELKISVTRRAHASTPASYPKVSWSGSSAWRDSDLVPHVAACAQLGSHPHSGPRVNRDRSWSGGTFFVPWFLLKIFSFA